MSIQDGWRRLIGNVAGWALFVFTVACLAALCVWAWWRFEVPLRAIFDDPLSLGAAMGFLVLLYLSLIAARASHERQYALFLIGRLQEVLFLRQWTFFIAPTTACVSLVMGYAMEGWQLPLTAVSVAGTVAAIYSFVKDVSGVWLRPVEHERYFFRTAQAPADGALMAEDRRIQVADGFRELGPWRGRRICVPADRSDWSLVQGCVISDAVNTALQDDASPLSSRPLERMGEPFKLTESLEAYAETALTHVRARGSLLHNEAKIRLVSEPARLTDASVPGAVVLQRTSYYASVCSNELTKFIVAPKEQPLGERDLFDTVRRKGTGVLYDLDDSELSNHMGGGTLALTSDGRLLVSKQGRLAAIAAGLLAPAGAGSMDWADQRHASHFGGLIKAGLERELREECSIKPSQIARTIVLGMSRELARGGKPDFYGLTLLKGRAAELQPRVDKGEIGLVDHHDHIPLALSNETALRQQLAAWLTEHQGRCSPALLMNLHLLIHARPETLLAMLHHMGAKQTNV